MIVRKLRDMTTGGVLKCSEKLALLHEHHDESIVASRCSI